MPLHLISSTPRSSCLTGSELVCSQTAGGTNSTWMGVLTHWSLGVILVSVSVYILVASAHKINCSNVDVTKLHQWEVNICSGYGWCHHEAIHYLSQCQPDLCHHMASLGHSELIQWPRGDVVIILKVLYQKGWWGSHLWTLFMKVLSGECYRIPLSQSQQWLKWWFGVIMQQANVDPDLLEHNELTLDVQYRFHGGWGPIYPPLAYSSFSTARVNLWRT